MINPITSIWAWLKGFNSEQLRCAFQIFSATIVILAIISPKPIWNALSYAGLLNSSLSVVVIFFGVGNHQGLSTLNAIFFSLAPILGGCISSAASWSAYAANNYSYAPNTVVKGVVFTLVTSVLAGIVNAVRSKHEDKMVFFLLSCVVMIFAGSLTTYYLPYVAWKAPFYAWSYLAIAALGIFLSSWLIFPITSGSKYRLMMKKALHCSADTLLLISSTLLSPLNPQTGKTAVAIGELTAGGTDAALMGQVTKIKQALTQARGCLIPNMDRFVALEIDIYNYPKRFFPRDAFKHGKLFAWQIINTLPVFSRAIHAGQFNLHLVHSSPVKEALEAVINHLITSIRLMGDILVSENTGDFQRIDDEIALLDESWRYFLDTAYAALNGCSNAAERYPLIRISSMVYMVGLAVRSFYVNLPGMLIVGTSGLESIKNARSVVDNRLKVCAGWVRPSDMSREPDFQSRVVQKKLNDYVLGNMENLEEEEEREEGGERRGVFLHNGGSGNVDTPIIDHKNSNGNSSNGNGNDEMNAALGRFRTRRASRAIWNMPLWFLYGLQFGVLIAITVALCAIPAVYYRGFHQGADTIAVTVVATWKPCIGGIHLAGWQRFLGTLIAAVWSYFMLAIAYLVNGCSWDDSPGKWIAACILLALWSGISMGNSLRYPHYMFAWLVSGFTVPLVTIYTLSQPVAPWSNVTWRIIDVAIAVALTYIVSAVFFPVTARRMVLANYDTTLENLKSFIHLLPELLETNYSYGAKYIKNNNKKNKNDNNNNNNGEVDSCQYLGTMSVVKSLSCPQSKAVVALALQIQDGLANTQSLLPFLAADYNPFVNPHRMKASDVVQMVQSVQYIKDMMSIGFIMERLNRTVGNSWEIPKIHHSLLSSVLENVAVSIDTLQRVINQEEDVSTALAMLSSLDDSVQCLLVETADLLKKENARGDGHDMHEMHIPEHLFFSVGLLLYAGISASEHVRLLYRSTVRAFLSQDKDAVRLVDEATQEAANMDENYSAEEFVFHLLNPYLKGKMRSVPEIIVDRDQL